MYVFAFIPHFLFYSTQTYYYCVVTRKKTQTIILISSNAAFEIVDSFSKLRLRELTCLMTDIEHVLLGYL